MSDQENYELVAKAINYIAKNFKQQPSLEELAALADLSPHHFQRKFSEWAGISPKKFLQYVSLEYTKNLLSEDRLTLDATAYETGLSGSSRLHDLFISIEGMTPGEYKQGGTGLVINYDFLKTKFGKVLCAATGKGICWLAFVDDEADSFKNLNSAFPFAQFVRNVSSYQQAAYNFLNNLDINSQRLKLHVKGTPFQLKVWEMLLKIPSGKVSTYGVIAKAIEQPKAARAVGTAIGSNPVAYLIPCHRVIQSTGLIGNYHWGTERKTAMLGWEMGKIDSGSGSD